MECIDDKGRPGFKFGESGFCYWHDKTEEGIGKAKQKAYLQGVAEGGGKLENAELSIDYLKAFHRLVSGHPHIYKQVIEEIHKRARGSAGGQAKAKRSLEGDGEGIELEDILAHPIDESPLKVTNAAPLSGFLEETDDYIDTSVVIAKEGVFTGTDSQPRFKPYDALAESSKWFLGTPITNGHIPGEVQPETRRIGQIINVQSRPDTRDVFGTARFFKNHLNEDELTRLRSGSPIDGSIGYKTPIKYETGKFNDADYVGIETGPFILDEYAILPDAKGACSSEMGCGIFQNAAPTDKLVLDKDGKVRKCPKKENEADQMTEEMEKKFNAALDEIKSLKDELEKLKNAAPVDIKPLEDKIADFETKFANQAKIESDAKIASEKIAFKKLLNAAAATESDTLYDAYKADPVGWLGGNKEKLLNEAETKDPQGKKQANASGAFDLQAKQAELWGY